MMVAWQVTPQKIDAVVRRVVRAAHPRRIILFGSAARIGMTRAPHDADFLVVTRRPIASPRQESVRLRRALRDFLMPMDILVVSEHRLRMLANQPGLMYREALRGGRVVYEARA